MSTAELYAIAAAMRRAGNGQIRNDAARSLRAGREPVRRAVEESVLAKLPHRGGLAAWAADASFSYRVTAGLDVIARVRVGKAGHYLAGLDDGLVIHPGNMFGPGWYEQLVPPHTISDPIREEGGDQLEQAGVAAIDRAVATIISA